MTVIEQPTATADQPDSELATTRPARARLEQLLGRDLAQRLMLALAPAQRRRGSSSP